jgi:hypothetical protein
LVVLKEIPWATSVVEPALAALVRAAVVVDAALAAVVVGAAAAVVAVEPLPFDDELQAAPTKIIAQSVASTAIRRECIAASNR